MRKKTLIVSLGLLVTIVLILGCIQQKPKTKSNYEIAINTNNASLCEKIGDQPLIDICYYTIAINTNDIYLCEKVEDPERRNNRCYYKFLLKSVDEEGSINDPSVCEKIENSYFTGGFRGKDQCYYIVARKNKDPSLCSNIEHNSTRYWCRQLAR